MTENDLAIQKLRRENKRLQKTVEDYRKMHQTDIAEIALLKRMIEDMVLRHGEDA